MTKIKICGLTNIDDIDYANEALPDYIGFVFAESKRQIDFHKASNFKKRLSPNIKSVGVFVNEEISYIKKLCDENIIDIIQLHGDENEEYIEKLNKLVKNPIIKSLRIINQVSNIETNADYTLFDTFSKKQYGGSGESFNWDLIKFYKQPFFLAGGLNISNIEKAIKQTSPFCVDISSGVETDGIKDRYKMIEIVKKVRSIDNYE